MRGGPTDSDSDLPSSVFFTYKLEDREEHLSPEELLASTQTSGKLFPLIGANGVPQYVSHSQKRRVLGERRELVRGRDKENWKPRVGQSPDIAELHNTRLPLNKDLTELKDLKQRDQNEQVRRAGLSLQLSYLLVLDFTKHPLPRHSGPDLLGGVPGHEGETSPCGDVPADPVRGEGGQ